MTWMFPPRPSSSPTPARPRTADDEVTVTVCCGGLVLFTLLGAALSFMCSSACPGWPFAVAALAALLAPFHIPTPKPGDD